MAVRGAIRAAGAGRLAGALPALQVMLGERCAVRERALAIVGALALADGVIIMLVGQAAAVPWALEAWVMVVGVLQVGASTAAPQVPLVARALACGVAALLAVAVAAMMQATEEVPRGMLPAAEARVPGGTPGGHDLVPAQKADQIILNHLFIGDVKGKRSCMTIIELGPRIRE